jgi:hypothetical protein
MNNFKSYFENDNFDIFGFNQLEKERDNLSDKPDDDMPITLFSVDWLMNSLARKRINNVKANHDFLDEIYWGNKKVGTIRVRLTPNTNVYIERLMADLEGNPIWICKRLFKIDQRDFQGKEDIVADDIFKEVIKIDSEKFEAAKADWKDLQLLVSKLVQRIRTAHGDIFMYQDVKKVRKNYYVIWFSIAGAGTGRLLHTGRRSQRTPEATVDVAYDDVAGTIHIILSTVSGGDEGLSWEIDVPYLDAFYAPSQSREEIVDTIVTALKYY